MLFKTFRFVFVIIFLLNLSCSSGNDEYTPIPQDSLVNFEINEVPYQTLSEYNFFDGEIKNLNPVTGVLPYEPITPLFSDYSKKQRLIWMPEGQTATYVDDNSLIDMPIGTVLIKTFYYDNTLPNNLQRIIETRLMIKKSSGWIFADYIWNEEQIEATLDLQGSFLDVEWVENGTTKSTTYRIPPESECLTCHKSAGVAFPIGLKPKNLNKNYTYSDGVQNQLSKFQEAGYLSGNIPSTIDTVVDWEDTSQPLSERVRAYLDINCAHCHTDLGHCDYRPLRLSFDDTTDEANIGVCVDADEPISPMTKIILAGNYQKSILHFRFSTNQQEFMMPLLGRTIVHEEAVDLIEQWINSLPGPCP